MGFVDHLNAKRAKEVAIVVAADAAAEALRKATTAMMPYLYEAAKCHADYKDMYAAACEAAGVPYDEDDIGRSLRNAVLAPAQEHPVKPLLYALFPTQFTGAAEAPTTCAVKEEKVPPDIEAKWSSKRVYGLFVNTKLTENAVMELVRVEYPADNKPVNYKEWVHEVIQKLHAEGALVITETDFRKKHTRYTVSKKTAQLSFDADATAAPAGVAKLHVVPGFDAEVTYKVLSKCQEHDHEGGCTQEELVTAIGGGKDSTRPLVRDCLQEARARGLVERNAPTFRWFVLEAGYAFINSYGKTRARG